MESIYSEGPEDFDPEDSHCIAQEYAMEIDREYFRTHPGETSYVQLHIKNEFAPFVYEGYPASAKLGVKVVQIEEGVRARIIIAMIPIKVKMKRRVRKR